MAPEKSDVLQRIIIRCSVDGSEEVILWIFDDRENIPELTI